MEYPAEGKVGWQNDNDWNTPANLIYCISCGKVDISVDAFFNPRVEGCCFYIEQEYRCFRDINEVLDKLLKRLHHNLNVFFSDSFCISGGGLLIVGILTEDLLQVVVTFLDDDNDNDSDLLSRDALVIGSS